MNDFNPICFNTNNNPHKDVRIDTDTHFHRFLIRNSQIEDLRDSNNSKLIFYDTPFLFLSEKWTSVKYSIEFETWLQYNTQCHQSPLVGIKPILSFSWQLGFEAIKNNEEWSIIDSTGSSGEDIFNSIIKYKDADDPMLPSDFPRLYSAVSNVIDAFY